MCLDSLDLIFVTFKTPASRSRAYCDCNPIRAFETFDISKEPISKTSRFWMFWYKRGFGIGSALSKGWRSGPEAFCAGHFLRLDRNRKPRMKSLWHPGYTPPDLLARISKVNPSNAKKLGLIRYPRICFRGLIYCDHEPLWLLNVIQNVCYFLGCTYKAINSM